VRAPLSQELSRCCIADILTFSFYVWSLLPFFVLSSSCRFISRSKKGRKTCASIEHILENSGLQYFQTVHVCITDERYILSCVITFKLQKLEYLYPDIFLQDLKYLPGVKYFSRSRSCFFFVVNSHQHSETVGQSGRP